MPNKPFTAEQTCSAVFYSCIFLKGGLPFVKEEHDRSCPVDGGSIRHKQEIQCQSKTKRRDRPSVSGTVPPFRSLVDVASLIRQRDPRVLRCPWPGLRVPLFHRVLLSFLHGSRILRIPFLGVIISFCPVFCPYLVVSVHPLIAFQPPPLLLSKRHIDTLLFRMLYYK